MSESKSESKSESNPESKSGAKSSAASVLDAVESFCTSSDLETEFENFAEAHADIFLAATEIPIGEEHPIEFHDVYMKYLSQFERRIESFIAKEGFTLREFYAEAKAILESDEIYVRKRFFLEALLATSEYDSFYMLMRSEMQKYKVKSPSKK